MSKIMKMIKLDYIYHTICKTLTTRQELKVSISMLGHHFLSRRIHNSIISVCQTKMQLALLVDKWNKKASQINLTWLDLSWKRTLPLANQPFKNSNKATKSKQMLISRTQLLQVVIWIKQIRMSNLYRPNSVFQILLIRASLLQQITVLFRKKKLLSKVIQGNRFTLSKQMESTIKKSSKLLKLDKHHRRQMDRMKLLKTCLLSKCHCLRRSFSSFKRSLIDHMLKVLDQEMLRTARISIRKWSPLFKMNLICVKMTIKTIVWRL